MHLTRIEDKHDEVVLAQVLGDGGLVVAGGFETDPLHAKVLQAFGDKGVAGRVIRRGEALGATGDGDVERDRAPGRGVGAVLVGGLGRRVRRPRRAG